MEPNIVQNMCFISKDRGQWAQFLEPIVRISLVTCVFCSPGPQGPCEDLIDLLNQQRKTEQHPETFNINDPFLPSSL